MLAHVEDEVIFVQPIVIGLDQRGAGAFDLLLNDLLGEAGEVGIPNPAAGQADERVPVAGKRQLEDHAEYAVVVVLDLGVQALTAFEHQRLDALNHRRPLDSGRILERGA